MDEPRDSRGIPLLKSQKAPSPDLNALVSRPEAGGGVHPPQRPEGSAGSPRSRRVYTSQEKLTSSDGAAAHGRGRTSAHRREQVDGSEGWEDLRADVQPAWGFVEKEDRGGRVHRMPWFSPAQVGRAVAARARREVQKELRSGRPLPRRRKRDKATGDLVEGIPKPRFSPLVERALQYEHCVTLDLDEMPRDALQMMQHDTCGTVYVGPRSCDLRACERCNGRRFEKYLADVEAWIAGANVDPRYVRLLTLTVPSARNLREGVDDLLRDVKLLRRRPWFKNLTRGGVIALQWTKHGPDWHVHAHLVLVGTYIPREMIVNAWADIRGIPRDGSVGVDIRAWRGKEWKDAFKEALGYVYPTKPRLYPKLEDFATVEVELRGKRLVSKFGVLYNVSAPREPRACSACLLTNSDWTHKGSATECEHAAFLATVRSDRFSGELGAMVPVNRPAKVLQVNPAVRVARRKFSEAKEREEFYADRDPRRARSQPRDL